MLENLYEYTKAQNARKIRNQKTEDKYQYKMI